MVAFAMSTTPWSWRWCDGGYRKRSATSCCTRVTRCWSKPTLRLPISSETRATFFWSAGWKTQIRRNTTALDRPGVIGRYGGDRHFRWPDDAQGFATGRGPNAAQSAPPHHSAAASIDWEVLLAIAASFAVGTALETTCVANEIATGMIQVAANNPWLSLAIVYLVTLVATTITNNAASLTFPFALDSAAVGRELHAVRRRRDGAGSATLPRPSAIKPTSWFTAPVDIASATT